MQGHYSPSSSKMVRITVKGKMLVGSTAGLAQHGISYGGMIYGIKIFFLA